MPPGYYLIVLSCLFATSLARKSQNDWENNEWTHSNTMSKEPGERHDAVRYGDTIDIDNENQEWSIEDRMADWPGSGAGHVNDDWGSGWTDDEDDGEYDNFSGYGGRTQYPRMRSGCEKLRDEILSHPIEGAYLPECTPDGEYQIVQCDRYKNMCWCVDRWGMEIKNTRAHEVSENYCLAITNPDSGVITPSKRPKPGSGPGEKVVHPNTEQPKTEDPDIIYEPPKEDKEDIEIEVPDGEDEEEDTKPTEKPKKNDEFKHSAIISTPGLLPGIIGGAVVGLLCAVLLVMFIVYRMRKKDEGSYALEEPKMTSPSRGYTRAPTKEYWA